MFTVGGRGCLNILKKLKRKRPQTELKEESRLDEVKSRTYQVKNDLTDKEIEVYRKYPEVIDFDNPSLFSPQSLSHAYSKTEDYGISSSNSSQISDSVLTTPVDTGTPLTLSYPPSPSVISVEILSPSSPTESVQSKSSSSLTRWLSGSNSGRKLTKKKPSLQKKQSLSNSRPLSTVRSISGEDERIEPQAIIFNEPQAIIFDEPQELASREIQIHEMPVDNVVPEEKRTKNIGEALVKNHMMQQNISTLLSGLGIDKPVKDSDLTQNKEKLFAYLSDNLQKELQDTCKDNPYEKRRVLIGKMTSIDTALANMKQLIHETQDLERLTSGQSFDTKADPQWQGVVEKFLETNKRMHTLLQITRGVCRSHYDSLYHEMPYYSRHKKD